MLEVKDIQDIINKLEDLKVLHKAASGDAYRVKYNDVREDHYEVAAYAHTAIESLESIISALEVIERLEKDV